MAYKRILFTTTPPTVLGIRISSSDATISGDYMKTAQTNSGYAVFHCTAKEMYLFAGYAETDAGMGNYWALNSTVVSTLGEMDWDSSQFQQSVYAMHSTSDEDARDMDTMEVSEDFTNPNSSFLTSTWTTASGTVSITASDIVQDPLPLLDEFHVDWSGRANRLSTAMDIPHEGLVFDAPFTSQVAKAVTGQTLTYNLEGSGHFTTFYGLPALRTSWSYDSFKTNVTWSDASFPAGRDNRTVSMWVECEGGWGTAQIFTYGNKFQVEYSDDHGAVNIASDHGDHRYYTPITIGKWYHIAVVLQHEYLLLYMNGKLVYTAEFKSPKSTELTNLAFIGADNGNGGNPGAITGLRIYSRALGLPEIGRLFDEHKDVVSS